MSTLARDASISGYLELKRSLESVLNVRVLIGIRKETKYVSKVVKYEFNLFF